MPVRNKNYTQPCQQMLQTSALHTIIITIFFPVKMPLTFDQKMKTAHMVFGHKILHLLFLAQKMNKLFYIKQYQPRVFQTNLPATMISTQSIHFCATVWADES